MNCVPSIRIFVSYSHLDRDWFAKLQPLLKFRQQPSIAYVWHDQELKAGDRWVAEIKAELEQMDIFLCLVSYYLLASDFICDVELKEAIDREKQGRTIIVPLLICDMAEEDIEELRSFNPLPEWGRSWRSYERGNGHTMDAHRPIRKGLWEVIDMAAKRKAERLNGASS